jgi:hypothetical protein
VGVGRSNFISLLQPDLTMTNQIPKRASQKKTEKTAQKTSPKERIAFPENLRNEHLIDYIITGLIVAYFFFYIYRLYSFLGDTFFWADENVHSYISFVISKTHSIPAELPDDIYGGFVLSYPPFFHILNAFVIAAAGLPALKYTNLLLLILFLLGFYVLIRKHYGHYEALIACLLISLSPTIAINSVRFMTEMLSMVLIFLSFFYLVIAIKKTNVLCAIVSGLATGLLMLSKQLGIVVSAFYGLLLLWFFFKKKKETKLMLYVVGTATCVFIPYLSWAIYNGVEVFGFLSLFLGNKPEWATTAVKSFRRYDSSLKEFAFLFYTGNGVVITASYLIPLYHFVRNRTKDSPQNYLFLMSVYLTAVMVVWHITNSRHTISLLPLIAFLTGYALYQIITNKIVLRALISLLLIFASYSMYHMPNYRQRFNAPKEFINLAEIIQRDNVSDGRTLVIYAFDTVMYSRKPVIWPYPNLRTIPINLFEKHPPNLLYGLLKDYNINFILIDTRFILKNDNFIGRNYPRSFIKNCQILKQQGNLTLQAISKSNNFVLLKVI